jgi:hypothetical protein
MNKNGYLIDGDRDGEIYLRRKDVKDFHAIKQTKIPQRLLSAAYIQ